ncbi:serine O-acetyltransferase [Chelatococcus asaccharovorans]|uniref:Serine acetyltransferase n=1 Tax=Chelatococcus asaccharovorans TaxID=28210 RepID=A0A2V3USE2_9HYPH|nr:serine O-acetyltransferase [Chelatococcus asaccharovorans]MBS7707439.1 serine O-acetyltransferase [Chelatococcus asaccharovorans]PXW63619.1 serine O-acetyltransferase [Chelatococcus asaccharovorans]CAH1650099.1 serine acetyltransferase [Chelatococcus asaccharovorans]CAH1692041.1 serine acetyltransferase [Chelatococcus asaccharovorans]
MRSARQSMGLADPIWLTIQAEAREGVAHEPELASLLYAGVLHRSSLEEAVAARVASRIAHDFLLPDLIEAVFLQALRADRGMRQAIRADLAAVLDRDPATTRYLEPLLHFKGFHALQAHRLSHWLWSERRRDLSLAVQSAASEALQVDIHPAVKIGRGIFFDHATGIVIGETSEIEDDVSILQGVTLGGTGSQGGDRHPKIRSGVLIGAGATLLGHIEIGHGAMVGAGSVVLHSVPPFTTVAGVPAVKVGTVNRMIEPAKSMDQMFYDVGL